MGRVVSLDGVDVVVGVGEAVVRVPLSGWSWCRWSLQYRDFDVAVRVIVGRSDPVGSLHGRAMRRQSECR
jgi:hypothetical protein